MMRSRFPTLAMLAVALLATAASPPKFSAQRVSADDKMLASNAFEGRAPATPGEAKTVAFIIRQMRAAGLQPGGPLAGGHRAWTQPVPLLRSEIAGTPQVSVGDEALVQGRDIAIRAPLNGQTRVDLDHAPLVFVGYGVSAPERGWDDFKGIDLHGKIAVLLINDPDFEAMPGDNVADFGGKAMTYYGRWMYKFEEAARRGAAGVLIVHEYAPAAYGWPTVTNSNTIAQFDIVRKAPAAAHTALESWITRETAVKLFAASGLDFAAEKAKARDRNFKPIPLKPALTAHYTAQAEVIRSHNVVGVLPGRTRPGESVIYSAHWDHLGVGGADARGDRIYNGAVDNASGVAALLELARAYGAAPRSARSVVFLAVTAEERGLLGSEYYAQTPIYPLATTAGVLNMDGPFGWGKAKDFTISGSAKLGLLDLLTAEAAKQGRTYAPDPHPEAGSFYRSDHFPFAKQGVPAVSYSNGQDLVDGGKARGQAIYEAWIKERYHQPADEWRAIADWSAVPQVLEVLYSAGRKLADGRDWPQWSPDSEFKATRDRTAAMRK